MYKRMRSFSFDEIKNKECSLIESRIKKICSKDKGIVKLEVTVKSGTLEDNKKILQEIRQMVRKLNRNEKKYGYVVAFKENA